MSQSRAVCQVEELEQRSLPSSTPAPSVATIVHAIRSDVLSLLLDASDEEGHRLDDQQVRDEVMTLLFAGHDTTTSTVAAPPNTSRACSAPHREHN